jgi:5'-phosphate synthase pdxT subunit
MIGGTAMSIRIGLAMLQGARHEHGQALMAAAEELGVETELICLRTPADLTEKIDGLVLPGGESTTMRIASKHQGLLVELFQWIKENPEKPVMGTCAGAILMCEPPNGNAALISAQLSRNSWGRQVDSFQAPLQVEIGSTVDYPISGTRVITDESHLPLKLNNGSQGDAKSFPGVFIRAPRFESLGNAEIIAQFNDEVVGVREGRRIALTFHPELTFDRRFHRWLLECAMDNLQGDVQ